MGVDLATDVEQALSRFVEAAAKASSGLETAADPETGERWDLVHVVGHVAEMLEFWSAEVCRVAARGEGTPFGRLKVSPERISRIEASAARPLEELQADVERRGRLLADLVRVIGEERCGVHGVHPTKGAMTIGEIVEEFGAAHLREHAAQLEGGEDR